ncbi:MAG: hypothetical protein HOV94_38495 [Saccharothrix sp.]|nr:hypothetical protein [Saccharothrix sp.]
MPDDEPVPRAEYPMLLARSTIRILMVTDASGSYDPQYPFSLNELIRVLREGTDEATITVTKAHRGTDAYANGADVKDFRFDDEKLDLVADFDELWLFGVDRRKKPLGDLEIQVIAEFMQAGGGVFATGDHEDMGWALCGRLPRVRSMRKWNWEPGDPADPDDPYAPPVGTPKRHDTVQRQHEGLLMFTLSDQSDDIPQVISPRYYLVDRKPLGYKSVVHPLLSLGDRVVTKFPDHPHEGECYVPKNLDRKFRIGDVEHDEYPADRGRRAIPEVVAWSSSGSRPEERDAKGVLDATTFGAVGAYDGHRHLVGRVVVDSTWHHFFDINLVGDRANKDPRKRKGFAGSAAGQEAYEEIKAYFRNIVTWLAPLKRQERLWWRALWAVRWHHQVQMNLRTEFYDDPTAPPLDHLREVGHSVLTAYPEAIFRQWAGRQGIGGLAPAFWDTWGDRIDPWTPDTDADPSPLPTDLVLETLLGAMVYGVAATHPELTDDARARAVADDWPAQARAFLGRALDELGAHAQRTVAGLTAFSAAVADALPTEE